MRRRNHGISITTPLWMLLLAATVHADFRVNAITDNTQEQAAVAVADDGRFVVVWRSYVNLTPPPDTWEIHARMFDPDGTPLAAQEFSIYSAPGNFTPLNPSVDISDDGTFMIIAWLNQSPTFEYEVVAQRCSIDTSGDIALVGSLLGVSTALTTEDSGALPRVAMDPVANGFMVVWDAVEDLKFGDDIFARQFNADGTSPNGYFQVNDSFFENVEQSPAIGVDASGRYFIVWSRIFGSDVDHLYARRYLSDGTPETVEFRIDDPQTAFHRHSPRIAVLDDGAFAVAFRRLGGGIYQLRVRFFGPANGSAQNPFVFDRFVFASTGFLSTVFDVSANADTEVTVARPENGLIKARRYTNVGGEIDAGEFQVNTTIPYSSDLDLSGRYLGFTPPMVWEALNDVYALPTADCNGNLEYDTVDVAAGTSIDCDQNGAPDECDVDCDDNGSPDPCELLPTDEVNFNSPPNMGLPILDLQTVTHSIFASAPGCDGVLDVNVELEIDHANNSDLHVTLEHVDSGWTQTLINFNTTGAADGFFVVLDDEAIVPIASAANDGIEPDIEGRYQPSQPLSVFDIVTDRCGEWQLTVTDSVGGGNEGSLQSWALHLATNPAAQEDCNNNDIPDNCDVTSFDSADIFGIDEFGVPVCEPNGVPDECEWPPGRGGFRSAIGQRQGSPFCQEPDQATHGSFALIHSDEAFGSSAADSFTLTANEQVDQVRWWGAYLVAGGVNPCATILDDDFTLTVHTDAGGLPGAVVSFNALGSSATRIPTGNQISFFGNLYDEYQFTADLLQPFTANAGETYWVVIERSIVDTCAWWWETAPPGAFGDGSALWDENGSGYSSQFFDLALCLNASQDCNENSIDDSVDISNGTSIDCDADGVPDECQNDCNGNGVGDECDILSGISQDLNANGLPDECDCVTMSGDADRDCDVDVRDFINFQTCFTGPAGPTAPLGCACQDLDGDDDVDLIDFDEFSLLQSVSGPGIAQPLCIPWAEDTCPDVWTTGVNLGTTHYNFTDERTVGAGFFGAGSLPFSGQVVLTGRPASSNEELVWDTKIEHGPIQFGESTEVTVPAWVSALFLISWDPIDVYFDNLPEPEKWRVLATLSPMFPGEGYITATLDSPTSNHGTFDAVVSVQPLFVFVREDDLLNDRVPAACVVPLMLDTAVTGLNPITLTFQDADFLRFVDQTVLDQYNISPCAQGNFVPGFSEGRLARGNLCLSHVTEDEAHFFCPPECVPPKFCEYSTHLPGEDNIVIGCDGGVPAPPSKVGGKIGCTTTADCDSRYPHLVHCSGGGVAILYYENPECVQPSPICKGACLLDNCVCQIMKEDECTDASGSYQGHGSKCDDVVDLDADSDADGSVNGSDVEEIIEMDELGPFIAVNDDDDNNNLSPDTDDAPVSGENDLEPINLSNSCADVTEWRLSWTPADSVAIWQNPDKSGQQVANDGTWVSQATWAMPSSLHVEGRQAGAVTLTLEARAADGTVAGSDTVKVVVIRIDLAVDSDNDGDIDADDNRIEDYDVPATPKPGRFLSVNRDDDDSDGIIDFVDGYSLGLHTDDAINTAGDDFIAIEVEIEEPLDLAKILIDVDYPNPSDPNEVLFLGTPQIAVPANGTLRLWTNPENAQRDGDGVLVGGDFVDPAPGGDPDFKYTAAQLGFDPGRSHTFYLEGIGASSAIADGRIVFKVDPDGDQGNAGFAAEDAVRVTCINVDLDADVDRDNDLNDLDESKEEEWSKGRGAIFMVNYDDDDSDGKPDAIRFDDEGNPDDENTDIDGPNDVQDVTPFIVRSPGPKNFLQFFLRASADDVKAIHVFEKREADKNVLWGGWTVHGAATGTLEKDVTTHVTDFTDLDLGIEGLFFRGQKHDLPGAAGTYEFDGEVDIELVVQNTTGATAIDSTKIIGTDTVRVKVAPYLILPNTRPAVEVWMDNDAGADAIAMEFSTLAQRAAPSTSSQWFQDHIQIGYTAMPSKSMHITLRLPYDPHQDTWPETHLLSDGEGLFRYRNTYLHDSTSAEQYGGNLEIVPYSDEYPLGRILFGNNMSTALKDFFKAQQMAGPKAVQDPFGIDVGWLFVGHVDEIIGFLPGGTRGYKVAVASPEYAEQLVRSGDSVRGVAEPPSDTAIFASGSQASGTASNSISTTDNVYLFDGAAHGHIKCIPKGSLVDGETIAINDGTAAVTFEFDTNGAVGGGHVAVNVAMDTTAEQVRNRLLAAIASSALAVTPHTDATEGIVLIRDALGTTGNQAIVETVADAAFVVQGMSGGEPAADGRNFMTPAWGYIRIYDGTAAGYVAIIQSRGNGWISVKPAVPMTRTVFNTTSFVAWNNDTGVDGVFRYVNRNPPLIPSSDSWPTPPPDNTSKYIVVVDCQQWRDGDGDFPALHSIHELEIDTTLWALNAAAMARIFGAKTTIISSMGTAAAGGNYLRAEAIATDDSLTGDADDDFVSLPVIFFGRWDGTLADEANVAYSPDVVNAQIATPATIVYPKPFGPIGSGTDVFEQATSLIIGSGAKFADNWDLFHRWDGEVHCATAVKRDPFSFLWWENQP